jgi:hypothetical protein
MGSDSLVSYAEESEKETRRSGLVSGSFVLTERACMGLVVAE